MAIAALKGDGVCSCLCGVKRFCGPWILGGMRFGGGYWGVPASVGKSSMPRTRNRSSRSRVSASAGVSTSSC